MKKIIYILAWVVLGLILSFIAHAVIEIKYINHSLSAGIAPVNYMVFGRGYCALPGLLQLGLPILGIVFGFLAGWYFWKVVYIKEVKKS